MLVRILTISCLCMSRILGGTIDISPQSSSVSPGAVFTLDVNVDSVSDLYAYQFDLKFDANILQALSETEGDFLASAGSTLFFSGSIDNTGGSVTGTGDTLEGPIPGASGSGVLAQFSFQAVAAGTTSIDILSDILLDSTLSGISTDVEGGTVSVESAPEPSSGDLFWLGAIGVVCLSRRRWRRSVLGLSPDTR
ncbi:MAG TPA: cohesin domain-containing protein [Bryobacteraceae bacterium]|nr:cohesin domain-containing protein [Bryobacteraceae bacterium]